MSAIFSNVRTSRGRQALMRLVLGGFLLRALIPIGFMPGSPASGGPFIICHGGLAGAFFEQLSEQAHAAPIPGTRSDHAAMGHGQHPDPATGSDEHAAIHEAWDHCPTGATAGAAALAPDFAFTLLTLSHTQVDAAARFGIPASPLNSYQARAPPPNLAQRRS